MVKICKIIGCNKQIHSKLLCSMHYARMRTTGDPLKTKYDLIIKGKCRMGDCNNLEICKGLCDKHYRFEIMKDPEFRDKRKKSTKKSFDKLKNLILNQYSINKPKCVCCGEKQIMFLTIDHINNDGNKHRKEIGSRNLYRWLKNNGFPEGFQVLCRNCNWGKHVNGGSCPHGG